jgi:hypothetical protein
MKSPTDEQVIQAVKDEKPAMVTIDAFRWFVNGQESKPDVVTAHFKDMVTAGSSWVVVHHLRKDSRDKEPLNLEDVDNVPVHMWFQEVSGTLAILNQSFTRMAVIAPKAGADLYIRWVVKVKGEDGPIHVERLFEPNDDKPIGYTIACGATLLGDKDAGRYSMVAGKALTFQQVTDILGGVKGTTSKFNKVMKSVGLMKASTNPNGKGKLFVYAPLG